MFLGTAIILGSFVLVTNSQLNKTAKIKHLKFLISTNFYYNTLIWPLDLLVIEYKQIDYTIIGNVKISGIMIFC